MPVSATVVKWVKTLTTWGPHPPHSSCRFRKLGVGSAHPHLVTQFFFPHGVISHIGKTGDSRGEQTSVHGATQTFGGIDVAARDGLGQEDSFCIEVSGQSNQLPRSVQRIQMFTLNAFRITGLYCTIFTHIFWEIFAQGSRTWGYVNHEIRHGTLRLRILPLLAYLRQVTMYKN